jgi:hypothetical protein
MNKYVVDGKINKYITMIWNVVMMMMNMDEKKTGI